MYEPFVSVIGNHTKPHFHHYIFKIPLLRKWQYYVTNGARRRRPSPSRAGNILS